MAKEEWKGFGKNIGGAFKSFGKAMGKTAKVVVDDLNDDNKDKPKEDTGLKEAWTEVGHGFGDTGKSLGKAVSTTAKEVVNDDKKEKEN